MPDEKRVAAVFDQIAGVYDPMNQVLTFGQFARWQRVFARSLPPALGLDLLDVGCGTGDLCRILAEKAGPSGRVTGVDLAPAMLDVARAKLTDLAGQVTLLEANALQLPFKDASFDGVTAGFSLRNMADLDRALKEMRRVLRPGGFLLALDVSKPDNAALRAVFLAFFYHVVPFIGLLGGRGLKPYTWLSESLREFPDRKGLEDRLRQAGFSEVRSRALSLGAAALHFARKPS